MQSAGGTSRALVVQTAKLRHVQQPSTANSSRTSEQTETEPDRVCGVRSAVADLTSPPAVSLARPFPPPQICACVVIHGHARLWQAHFTLLNTESGYDFVTMNDGGGWPASGDTTATPTQRAKPDHDLCPAQSCTH